MTAITKKKPAPAAGTPEPKAGKTSHLWKASAAARKARAAARKAEPTSDVLATKPARPKAPLADRRLLTIKSTCEALDCCRTTVLRLIKVGKLRMVYLGPRAVRVVAADVDALLG